MGGDAVVDVVGRSEYGATVDLPASFWLQSTNTLPRRSDVVIRSTTASGWRRDAGLEEVRPADALGEAVQRERPAGQMREQHRCDADVVIEHVRLRVAVGRPQHAPERRQVHGAAADVERHSVVSEKA